MVASTEPPAQPGGALDPLPVLTGKVNAAFNKESQYRITAGKLLVELKQRVDAGEAGKITWTAYVAQNIERSLRDCQKVMKLAGAADPEKEAGKERAEARDRMKAVRARQAEEAANVRRQAEPAEPPPPKQPANDDAFNAACAAAGNLNDEEWAAFREWFTDEDERRLAERENRKAA